MDTSPVLGLEVSGVYLDPVEIEKLEELPFGFRDLVDFAALDQPVAQQEEIRLQWIQHKQNHHLYQI